MPKEKVERQSERVGRQGRRQKDRERHIKREREGGGGGEWVRRQTDRMTEKGGL